MKNFTKLIAALPLMAVLSLVSCSSDDSGKSNEPDYVCETCSQTPDALAVNDNSIKGVYKGIFVGSTGTISIDIQNGSNIITATLVIDGDTIVLTSDVTVVEGETFVAPFTGTYNGSPISVTLSVGSGGSNPTMVSSDIPGHPNAVFELYKETSTSMIEAFEGTYSSTNGDEGTFNIVLSRSLGLWGGIAKENGENELDHIDGTVDADGTITADNGIEMGDIDGDELNGSFQDNNNATITITGYRTL